MKLGKACDGEKGKRKIVEGYPDGRADGWKIAMKGPGEDEMWMEWRDRPRDCSNTDEIYDQDSFESLLQPLISV